MGPFGYRIKKAMVGSAAVISAPGLFGPIPWPTSHVVVAADAEPSVMLTTGRRGKLTVPKKIGPKNNSNK